MEPLSQALPEKNMGRRTTVIDAEKLFGKPFNLHECQRCKDGFETYWEWPGEIGNGFLSLIKLRPGLMLGIGNYRLSENISFDYEIKSSILSIGFSVSGNMVYTVNSDEDQEKNWGFKQGHSCMTCFPERRGIATHSGGAPVRSVGIFIDPMSLNVLMEDQHNLIPSGIRDIIANGTSEKHYYQTSITNSNVNMVLHQIFNCPYGGTLKKLYLEGKSLELITHHMASLVAPTISFRTNPKLRPSDIESIREVKNILERNLENPPSLLSLARQVGVNKSKLSQGFRQIFGTSVFDYLRICRLERARELLESKNMNVTEVAFEVGYAQHSNFTRAFKKYFGINPIDYLR
jgi:AraC family transcriptional activator of pyochelin receptor